MRGCRPLNASEVDRVLDALANDVNPLRNQALFTLGVHTGFRISELLSLKLGDVVNERGEIVERIVIQRRNMKGKHASRSVLINQAARTALRPWINEMKRKGYILANDSLFPSSRARGSGKSIGRINAYNILKRAYAAAGLTGSLGTHSMRKTFANRVYDYFLDRVAAGEAVDAFRNTSKALGHASITSTDSYLSFREEDINNAIMSLEDAHHEKAS